MRTEQVPFAEQIAALQRCIEWSDHQVNLGIGYAPKENAALRAALASLSALAAANERIARLEGALETAARFHGIDVDVLCEQRVSAALEWAKVNRIEVIDHTKRLEHGGGRAYVFWKDGVLVEARLQDEGRTLKIFISNRAHPDRTEGGDAQPTNGVADSRN